MDPQQSQSRQHLKPHPHHPQQRASSSAASSGSAPSIPRPPLSVHPTVTIADAVVFQGTHPISIGAGTIIHPRARFYSFDGPIYIGDGSIISEKSVIGIAPTAPPPSSTHGREGIPIRISNAVVVGPQASVFPGAHIHSSTVVESLAIIHKRASLGSHSKVCAACEVPPNAVVREWSVVWGSGTGFGQRRKRAKGKMSSAVAVAQGIQGLEGKVIEDARLIVLHKEREALSRMIGSSAGAGARRR
ncbi:hypothetical protein ASPWEDRAFT_22463 [Aspergillus wentii DTO 134E9]|uniref:Dynactin subunit 6 n=1 Tax=Aspergillus wentii DTO 134E9 TaxID=1073089 RepID=A0A1L9RZC8_ASPWE|nr:uncharacterized protein ASPWEDRAFT_22463 [Aspergillus wentii DTO 134E9]KAI9932693.1 hypothetical protein MW887_008942 [Aspergillus wentii]OJJ40265.1 hypothetical protein ASPWEDRAFT_22463 [Aspergillus wentii DTO 134E9]